MGWYRYEWIEQFYWERLLSEITQTSLKLVVLDFGFVCDKLVCHIIRSNQLCIQYVLVSKFSTYYILTSTYGTYYILDTTEVKKYILARTGGKHFIILVLYVQNIEYYSHSSTCFVMTFIDFTISCSNKIVHVFKC